MEIRFNLSGNERKKLVTAIGEILEASPEYLGAPTFSYEIGGFVVDKAGTLSSGDETGNATAENLLIELVNRGFIYEQPDRLIIEIPKDGFTDATIENLGKLVDSKAALIKKALATDVLIIEQTDDRLQFPWFDVDASPEEVKAYTSFISALCNMAKTLHRVNAVQKDIDNEKFAFRCFLLRLGFIGAEFKSERKVLLKNLSGNSAFKNGVAEVAE